jgi:uncharacterized protein YndB with AHSA1/START domain
VIEGDRVTVTVTVEVAPADAFSAFTEDIDRWWRRGPAYRGSGTIVLECKPNGRLFEQLDDTVVRETGRVTVWEPPHRLAFEWRGVNLAPGETTLVEVSFAATASGHTRLTLVHSGFAALRPDHPVRHGAPVVEFIRSLGLWWGSLLGSLREHVAIGNTPPASVR